MRFQRWLMNEEDNIIQKALDIKEPEVNMKYDESTVADNVESLKIAIGKQTELIKNIKDDEEIEVARGILNDLEDKLKKWKNWKDETKSQGPNPEPTLPPETLDNSDDEDDEEDK
jgi:hypothetical protein